MSPFDGSKMKRRDDCAHADCRGPDCKNCPAFEPNRIKRYRVETVEVTRNNRTYEVMASGDMDARDLIKSDDDSVDLVKESKYDEDIEIEDVTLIEEPKAKKEPEGPFLPGIE